MTVLKKPNAELFTNVQDTGPVFVSIDIVDTSHIKSQWQAHFFQMFPIRMSELPLTDESDRECFEKNWKGDPDMTYDKFMSKHYPMWTTRYHADSHPKFRL